MRLFNTLSIEIGSLCSRRCAFCPVAYNDRPDEKIKKSLLKKIVSELAYLNYSGRIELYIYNEPTYYMDWLLECLGLCRKKVPRCCLMIATNGDFVSSPEDLLRMYQFGLNQLLINGYTQTRFESLSSSVNSLPKEVLRTRSVYSNSGPRKQSVCILNKSSIDQFGNGQFRLMNRAGSIPKFKSPLKSPLNKMCVKPFRILNINWKGEALVCCQDYHGALSFGNVSQLSLADLWNHPVMNSYRLRLSRKKRDLPMCRECDAPAGAYSYNVETPSGPYASVNL